MKNDWTAPEMAITPANPYHTLYLRLAAIHAALTEEMVNDQRLLTDMDYQDMRCGVQAFMVESGKLASELERYRRARPDIFVAFERAFNDEPVNTQPE